MTADGGPRTAEQAGRKPFWRLWTVTIRREGHEQPPLPIHKGPVSVSPGAFAMAHGSPRRM